MSQIIPAGGKRMDWVRDPESKVVKQAQDMFEDDPQLSAIKDLPGMADGIAELQGMETSLDEPVVNDSLTEPSAGGSVEKAVQKVEDAARAVADAAVADAEKAVTDAIKNIGKPAASPVSDNVDEICPEPPCDDQTDRENSETPEEDAAEEKCKDDIPGLVGEEDGKAKKEGDKEEKPAFAASLSGMKRVADLSAPEIKELRDYWKNSLGLPGPYVDAMLKKYTA